jgi:hypothetical protein
VLVITIWYEFLDVFQVTVPVSVTPPEHEDGETEAVKVVPSSETVDDEPQPPVVKSVARILEAWRRWVLTSPWSSDVVTEVVVRRLALKMITIATITSMRETPSSPRPAERQRDATRGDSTSLASVQVAQSFSSAGTARRVAIGA